MHTIINNSGAWWLPASSTTPGTAAGWAFTSSGTVATPTPQGASVKTQSRRTQWTTRPIADKVAGLVSVEKVCWRGASAGLGGFCFTARFTLSASPASTRAFVGLSRTSSNICGNQDPSTVADTLGIGFDSGDPVGGDWYLIARDATTLTKIALDGTAPGATGALPRNRTDVLEILLYALPNQPFVYIRIVNLSTGVVAYNARHTANLPTTLLYVHAQAGNAGSNASVQFELLSMTLDGRQELEFNVLDFGADPTGQRDSYAAFQAWSQAISDAGGGVGVVPPESYLIDQFTQRDGVGKWLSTIRDFNFKGCNGLRLTGYGAVLNLKGNVHLTNDGGGHTYSHMLSPFVLWDSHNVVLEGFEINGNANLVTTDGDITTEPGGNCVAVWGCTNVTIRNMRIHHGWTDGISVRRNNGDPFTADGAPSPHTVTRQVVIENCEVHANARGNISIHETRNVRISTCRIYSGGITGGQLSFSPGHGIDIEPDVTPPVTELPNQLITIDNCEIYGNALRALVVNVRYSHVVVRGCFIDNENEDQFPVVLSVPHCTLLDSEINVRTGRIDVALTGTLPGHNVFTIERCLVRGTDSFGLFIGAQVGRITKALVQNNRFINESTAPLTRQFPSLSHGTDMLHLIARDNYVFIPAQAYQDGGHGFHLVVAMVAHLAENNVYETDLDSGSSYFAVEYEVGAFTPPQYAQLARNERFISPSGTGFRPLDNSAHDNTHPFTLGDQGTP
jgi:hypothetical protein